MCVCTHHVFVHIHNTFNVTVINIHTYTYIHTHAHENHVAEEAATTQHYIQTFVFCALSVYIHTKNKRTCTHIHTHTQERMSRNTHKQSTYTHIYTHTHRRGRVAIIHGPALGEHGQHVRIRSSCSITSYGKRHGHGKEAAATHISRLVQGCQGV